MAIKKATPQQADDILTNGPNAVYIDVRTEGEFVNRHTQALVTFRRLFPIPNGHGREQQIL